MPATEIHHQKDGVLVSWGHSCGHLSNTIWYRDTQTAEVERELMERIRCSACRQPMPTT